jgi:GT2 family glycosyltransferase
MAVDVSIILVNYNSGKYLPDCLGSIYTHTKGISFEIILVDNASTDNSFATICEAFPAIRGLKNPSNLGFAAANNLGAKYAKGKCLLFLNPDTLLTSDSITALFRFLSQPDPKMAACGGCLQNPDGSYAVSYGNFPTLFQQFSDIGFRVFYRKRYEKELSISPACTFNMPQPVQYLSGADIMIKKAIFLQMGGFDEKYFMYYEDTDLFYRLHKAGYQSWLLPQVKIIHIGSSTTNSDGRFNYLKYEMMEKSKYIYFATNHGSGSVFLAKTFQMIALFTHYFGKFNYSLLRTIKITFRG